MGKAKREMLIKRKMTTPQHRGRTTRRKATPQDATTMMTRATKEGSRRVQGELGEEGKGVWNGGG